MYKYDENFYQYIERGSIRSSLVIIPMVAELIDVSSVLDVGCGRGAWLKTWNRFVSDTYGIDGDYIDRNKLHIPESQFKAVDLRSPFELGRKFSLVQCLEVAEHLPDSVSSGLVRQLCKHADVVLFSAATPGQGGENHINEQKITYWREHFSANGFRMYDPFRKKIIANKAVEPWYKYNTFLFVKNGCDAVASRSLDPFLIPEGENPPDYCPISYKARKFLIAILPVSVATFLAKFKKYAILFQMSIAELGDAQKSEKF